MNASSATRHQISFLLGKGVALDKLEAEFDRVLRALANVVVNIQDRADSIETMTGAQSGWSIDAPHELREVAETISRICRGLDLVDVRPGVILGDELVNAAAAAIQANEREIWPNGVHFAHIDANAAHVIASLAVGVVLDTLRDSDG